MVNKEQTPVRMLLLGKAGSAFRLAADMAIEAGAEVTPFDDAQAAIDHLRVTGSDMVMADVDLDVPAFIGQLRAERFAVPVLACGIAAPAERAVAAIRAGAKDYVPLPPDRELIAAAIASVAHRGRTEIIGQCPALVQAMHFGLAMAPASAAILVRGDAGTGKEMMARAIHDASRRDGPFVTVECGGVSEDMLHAELFGYEKGAFDGAVSRRTGRIEQARLGTLFIREIGGMAPSVQARLMDLLREGRSGMLSTARTSGAARLIASSSVELRQLVADGHFRADLLNHLGMIEVTLPPLRSRGSDIGLLAAAFASEAAQRDGLPVPSISPDALHLLQAHDWPGNVRELEAVMVRAVLLARGGTITAQAIVLQDGRQFGASAMPAAAQFDANGLPVDGLVGRSMADVERALILQTLEHCSGNRTTASTILGISVRTMRNKLRSFIDAGYSVAPF